jgi:hypothetical protein
MYTYTENSYTGGTQSIAERKALFEQDAQAIADAKGEPVTGNYKLPDGTYYTVSKNPSSQSTPPSPPPAPSSSSGTPANKDTAALVQRGVYQQPGFYGSQELKASHNTFTAAAAIGGAVAGIAALQILAPPAPPNYVRTPENYILTQAEKDAISSKSRELAASGVIPEDVLKQFFYTLAFINSITNLKTISDAVGIPELNNSRYIRNIIGITQIPDIYKIGYLSQAVYSINNKFSSEYSSAQQIDYPEKSNNGDILSAAALGASLGVIGSYILDNAYTNNRPSGGVGVLSSFPALSESSVSSSVNTFAGLAAGTLGATQLASITNPAVATQGLASIAAASTIAGLLDQSPLGGSLGSFGALGGIAAGLLLGQSGGLAIGAMMSEVITGKRLATSQYANNPMLTAPSFAGKSFFGEAPVSLPAVDQMFCRRVGAFGSPSNGSGVVSFTMQNFASMGGSIPISSVVSRMITGSPVLPPSTTAFGASVGTMVSNVCSNLNVPISSSIEMRRSDNAIPFMLGFSAAMVGENFSPFGSKPISSGWILAASAANDIQRYNPQYLKTCQSSL